MTPPISSIEITNVRGIRHLRLPVDGRNLVLVGENGSGKSSVVDAIEYFFTGHIEHLEGRQDVTARDAFPHISGGPTEVVLGWGDRAKATKVSVKFPGHRLTVPKGMQGYFGSAGSRSFILHRAQLLDVVNARDADRYKKLSDIIGLGDLDKVDDVWRAQVTEAAKEKKQSEDALRGLRSRLASLLNVAHISSEDDIAAGLSRLLARLGVPEIQERLEIRERQEAVQDLCQSTADQEKLRHVRAVVTLVDQVRNQTSGLIASYRTLRDSVHQLISLTGELAEAHLEHLLHEAVTVLDRAPDMDHCPLCEAPIAGVGDLLERVRTRLGILTAVTASRQAVGNNSNSLRDALKSWDADLGRLADLLERLAQTESLQALQTARTACVHWQEGLSTDDLPSKLALRLDEDPVLTTLQADLATLAEWMAQVSASLAPDQTQAAAFQILSVLERADEIWKQFQTESRKYQSALGVATQLDLVYQALLQARIQGLKRIAAELQDDFAHFYSELHPHEGCETIMLRVSEDRRASVGLRAAFHHQDAMQPLNYFSEGHLDSLGLCIFLAFIRRFNGDFRLMVLDDIWTAVDAGHRLKVAQLLAKEFGDYQMIVTTHDRLWGEQLNIVLPNSQVVQLRSWNLELGTCCLQTQPADWDHYRGQIANGRTQDAIAGVGRNLEKFLYQMRRNLGVAVPATPNDSYTIGDLYGPFFKWIRDHGPIARRDWQGFDDDVQAMDDELDAVWRLRNWSGAHFNEWGTHVTAQEALDFLAAVQRLVGAFSCPTCGALVVYNRGYGALTCPSCKVTPWAPVSDQYRADWKGNARRMLSTRNARAMKGIGSMMNGVLRRFLADMSHRLPIDLDSGDDSAGLDVRYIPLLTWAQQHPREGMANWMDAVSAMDAAFSAYWPDVYMVADDRKADLVNVVGDFTDLFTCAACAKLLSFDTEQQVYFCAACDRQAAVPQKVSAFWPIGQG